MKRRGKDVVGEPGGREFVWGDGEGLEIGEGVADHDDGEAGGKEGESSGRGRGAMFPSGMRVDLEFAFRGKGENGGGQERVVRAVVGKSEGHERESLRNGVGAGVVEANNKGGEVGVGAPSRAEDLAGSESDVPVKFGDDFGNAGVERGAAAQPKPELVSGGGKEFLVE